MVRSKKSTSGKKMLFISGAILMTALGIVVYTHLSNQSNISTLTTSTNERKRITPATEQEKQESDQRKNETTDRDSQSIPQAGTKKNVQPVIVDASLYEPTVEVRAYVPGVVEDSGTCTVTFAKNSLTVMRSSQGFHDAKTTDCTKITIDKSEFPELGSWTATVSYESDTASGTSAPRAIEIK